MQNPVSAAMGLTVASRCLTLALTCAVVLLAGAPSAKAPTRDHAACFIMGECPFTFQDPPCESRPTPTQCHASPLYKGRTGFECADVPDQTCTHPHRKRWCLASKECVWDVCCDPPRCRLVWWEPWTVHNKGYLTCQ
jgi:hypothetical protein